ncbi:hypothetical protein GF339_18785 [candidate division KSB3 bacterium]|jgi:hypothetical protein|uniref:Uncharacterized protein n=1 Tax=candidate division KSB3 bacterium TaxID=2044937 RepID=A0A9D5Q7T4_9BACT|nr:hypothetical protein [candidate division KSB3 bacterium]MBD3326637.1 hypothetical protein [candidate division KSB3 bacterium]
MKIFIDGDACSAKKVREKLAKKRGAEVVTVVSIENCSNLRHDKNTVVVDAAPQATDIEIFNRMQKGDMVVTKDYGLASLVLGKQGKAMSPSGFVYTKKNIEMLLHQRYVNGVARNTTVRKKRRAAKQRHSEVAFP